MSTSAVVKHSDFSDALQRCSGIVQGNPSPIVLKYCRLHFNKEKELLDIQATDGKIQVSHSLPILDSSLFAEDFDVLVDPKLAIPSLPGIKSDLIELECDVENPKVIIKGGKNKFSILSQPSQDFPKFAFPNISSGYKISSGVLKKMLTAAMSAINKDESKVVLTTACLEYVLGKDEIRKNSIFVIGANGQVITYSSYECNLGDEEFQILIPHSVIPSICKVLEDTDDVEIKYFKDDDGSNDIKNMFFKTKKAEVGCASIGTDYKYPPWERFVPGGVKLPTIEEVIKIAVPLEVFKESIKFAQVLSDKEFKALDISYEHTKEDSGLITIRSESDLGSAEIAPIECKSILNGDKSFFVKMSGKFLDNILNNINGNDIIITKSIDPQRAKSVVRFETGSVKSDIYTGGIVGEIKNKDKQQ